jgi:hypothetical protein
MLCGDALLGARRPSRGLPEPSISVLGSKGKLAEIGVLYGDRSGSAHPSSSRLRSPGHDESSAELRGRHFFFCMGAGLGSASGESSRIRSRPWRVPGLSSEADTFFSPFFFFFCMVPIQNCMVAHTKLYGGPYKFRNRCRQIWMKLVL